MPDGAKIIHHCNTGSLATVDYGTALGIIRTAHEQGAALLNYAPVGNVYAYVRHDDDERVMVMFNRGHEAATVDVDHYAEGIAGRSRAVDVISGKRYSLARDFVLEPRSVLVLELDAR